MIPSLEDLRFLDSNERRKAMLMGRDRGMASTRPYEPYTADELHAHFKPYLDELEVVGLSPREVRLIETIIYAWGAIIEKGRS